MKCLRNDQATRKSFYYFPNRSCLSNYIDCMVWTPAGIQSKLNSIIITDSEGNDSIIIELHDPPKGFLGDDLSYLILRYDEAGRFFRDRSLAMETAGREAAEEYRKNLTMIKNCCK